MHRYLKFIFIDFVSKQIANALPGSPASYGAASFVQPAKVRRDICATATLVRPQNTTFVRPDISATRHKCDHA